MVFAPCRTPIAKCGATYNDEKLLRSSQQVSEALDNIKRILSKLQNLKKLDLIKEKREKRE